MKYKSLDIVPLRPPTREVPRKACRAMIVVSVWGGDQAMVGRQSQACALNISFGHSVLQRGWLEARSGKPRTVGMSFCGSNLFEKY